MLALKQNLLKQGKYNLLWFYAVSLLFVVANIIAIANENYYFSLIPFAFLIILFAVFALDKLVLFIVFLTPISIPLREIVPHIKFDLSLPTEPLIFGAMLLFIFKLLLDKKFDKKVAYHPISLVIYANLIWMFITCITSSMPLVSFKYLISRIWFVVVFYFIAIQIFKNGKNFKRWVWLYVIPLLAVIAYTFFRLSHFGFQNEKYAHYVMNPLYNDHTSYAAALAMVLPLLVGFLASKQTRYFVKFLSLSVIVIIVVAIVFSYTRAAWVSLAGAIALWVLLKAKIKLRYIFAGATLGVIILMVFWTSIMLKLEQNRQDSSTNFQEHMKSISNVATDASNLERINRWSCAWRMFKEKPIFGWGPGTYMFNYAPFQLSNEKTIISTNAGDLGNAHSEYLGPLSESGLIGSITFFILILVSIYTGTMVYRKAKNAEARLLALSVLMGLVTYYIHGTLNNFLDTDKASALFWGFTGMLVALQVYHSGPEDIYTDKSRLDNEPEALRKEENKAQLQ